MSERNVLVHVDLGGTPHLAGVLWTRVRKGRETATFEYAPEWLAHPERFALEPGLALGKGQFHTAEGRALFGALGDSAPDRWGRDLIIRAERRRAQAEGRALRTLFEIDYLLRVHDDPRPGALRFAEKVGGPFLAEGDVGGVPPIVDLRRLLDATARFEDDEESEDDLRLLLAPGSSQGGARPKASVREPAGGLSIAKFPSVKDTYDVVRWEGVALALAERAGISVPVFRVASIGDKSVLLAQRFDRDGSRRIPFLSAMSLLGARDGETRSYSDIAEALRQHGSAVAADLPQLWRRMVFNVLISNLDDHLRNHAVLYAGSDGWRLSPAYDLNPVPIDIRPRFLSTSISIDGDLSASLELAFQVASEFTVSAPEAKRIAAEVGAAVATWRREAERLGLKRAARERMASAFEHKDLRTALAS